MFWLFSQGDNFDFYQIFNIFDKININDDTIYNISGTINVNTSNIPKTEIIYEIRIIDQLISYKNIESSETITFLMNMDKKPQNNNLVINCKYNKVSSERMPLTLTHLYNDVLTLRFQLYKISSEIIFVNEININTKKTKNYWLTNNLKNLETITSDTILYH